jgi:pyrroline-5-carboxylate reductase
MKYEAIGFMGGGRITRIILGGLQRAGKFPRKVVVSDTNADVLDRLIKEFPGIISAGADNSEPAGCDLVLVSLHPPVLIDALQQVKAAIKPGTVVVSLAPKLTLSNLSTILDRHSRIVRMIPNAPSIVNRGYNPVAFTKAIGKDERAAFIDLFKVLGECPEVPEKNLEAYAILTAMGPTYMWFQWQALIDLGRSFDLSEEALRESMEKMIEGAMQTMLASGLNPGEVMDLVPVKPLAEDEDAIRDMYTNRLTALYAKLKG